MLNITPAQLRKAADIQERIQWLQDELNQILGGEVPAPTESNRSTQEEVEDQCSG
jgi:hypothetical protein